MTASFSPWVLFSDLGLILGLLLIGKFIRVKVHIIQRLFIPPSLIAGILGLTFGPNGLGWLPFSDQIGTYPAILIAVVFASLAISSEDIKIKEVAHRVGPLWVYSQFGMLFQWAAMGIIGLLAFKAIWPQLHDAFGLMLPTGFYGGHGTAAAIGSAFGNLGWDEATSLGMTTATIGVILALIGGLMLIKMATRQGATSYLAKFDDLPKELRSGLLPKSKRKSLGEETTSPISMDSLTFHLAIIVVAAFGGYLCSLGVKSIWPKLELPIFSCAFVIGLLINIFCKQFKINDYIDNKTVSSLSSCATDLLVAFGVSAIKLGVVVKYAVPLICLLLVGTAVTLFTVFYFGRRLNEKHWFEKSIFAWGWWTGTMAMGIALLRIVDPSMRSKALDDYALAYLPCAPVEIILITLVPIAFCGGFGMEMMLVCLGISVALIILAKKMKWWNTASGHKKSGSVK